MLRDAAFLAILVALGSAGTADTARRASAPAWVTAWTASPQTISPGFSSQTLRLVVSPHGAGSQVRVRLTNRYAPSPVTFAEVHIGKRERGAALVPGTNRLLTFGGMRSVTVPAGGGILSDPVGLEVAPFEDLAVSIRFDGPAVLAPVHLAAEQTSYVTSPGSAARGGEALGDAYTQSITSWYYLDGIDVRGGDTTGAVGIIGDSITDTGASTLNANRRWPDDLQRRLLAAPNLGGLSVLNAGVIGNQVSRDSTMSGPAAFKRVGTDLLDLSGIRAVIVLEGINDIAGYTPPRATADEVIDGYRKLVDAVHARGLEVMAVTLTPTAPRGAFPSHTDAQAVAFRNQVSDWIRTSNEFDAVFDADAALRDPSGADRLDPAYDSGDGLHPNDAGLQAIANSIGLDVLRALQPPTSGGLASRTSNLRSVSGLK